METSRRGGQESVWTLGENDSMIGTMRGAAQPAVQVNLRMPPEVHERVKAESTASDVDKTSWILGYIQERFEKLDQQRKEVAR